MPYITETELSNYFHTIDELEAENARLREALKPFAHDDLCRRMASNTDGEMSPVYVKDKAFLYLGDFIRARKALE